MMKYTIGIDLGGTIIKVGLLQNNLMIDRSEFIASSMAELAVRLKKLENDIDYMLKSNNVSDDQLLGIGFSFAGIVNAQNNHIISTKAIYADIIDIDLTGWAKSKWGCPIFIENDARMALLGEWQFGEGVGCQDIVLVTLGTGIGTAVLMEGKILRGVHYQAGNLGGHFTVNHSGKKCYCGNIGCMESEVSTWSLPELIKADRKYDNSRLKNEKVLDFESLFRGANCQDSLALEVLDHCYSVWSSGIVTMIHAFDPEMVILAGGIMKSSAILLPELEKRITKNSWTPWGSVQLKKATNINDAALYGASFLVQSKLGLFTSEI